MAFENRDYYGGGGGGDDFLSNPASILQLSIPAGTYGPVRVRLHFWLLLTLVIDIMQVFRGVPIMLILISIALLFVALIIHDMGHVISSAIVGGTHHEWTWWPLGSMVMPQLPPGAGPLFIGSVGGIALNVIVAIFCGLWVAHIGGDARYMFPLDPLAAFSGGMLNFAWGSGPIRWLDFVIIILGISNWAIAIGNLLPYYWFDGGYLLQAILWPFIGLYQAINGTCIVGMIVAVPLAMLALRGGDFLFLLFAALLFYSAFMRRKQLKAEGVNELEDSIHWSAGAGTGAGAAVRRPWKMPGWAQKKAKEAAQRRKDEAQIDQILAKVSAQGMHSLTNKEKKILAHASERQRHGN